MTTFRALFTSVSVEIDDDVARPDVVHAILETYPKADTADVHYRLRATEVLRDQTSLPVDDPLDAIPVFELDLYEQVLARAEPGWILHAAAIEIDGKALVLCGPSGAGKTTLALTLVSRGLRLLTEEMVWIDRSGMVRGLPRPLHVSAGSGHHARIPAAWRQVPYPIRAPDGTLSDNMLVIPRASDLQLGALPLRALVRMGHGPDLPVHLVERRDHLGLLRLWDRSLRHDDGGLAAATQVLATHGAYELFSHRAEEALRLLEPLLNG